jgi:hypothetical protein
MKIILNLMDLFEINCSRMISSLQNTCIIVLKNKIPSIPHIPASDPNTGRALFCDINTDISLVV